MHTPRSVYAGFSFRSGQTFTDTIPYVIIGALAGGLLMMDRSNQVRSSTPFSIFQLPPFLPPYPSCPPLVAPTPPSTPQRKWLNTDKVYFCLIACCFVVKVQA